MNKLIGVRAVLSAAFLVPQEKEAAFDAAVDAAGARFTDKLDFKYTGPWPPYNFVRLNLSLEGWVRPDARKHA